MALREGSFNYSELAPEWDSIIEGTCVLTCGAKIKRFATWNQCQGKQPPKGSHSKGTSKTTCLSKGILLNQLKPTSHQLVAGLVVTSPAKSSTLGGLNSAIPTKQ